ncbi:P-loop containing nucleoside triphosphate hydrolase [Pleurotus pulmonarius]
MPATSIYIVGPSSTGKTTLCRALAEKLGLNGDAIVGEVAREVMRRTGFTRNDVGRLEMQRAIMEAHLLEEEKGLGCSVQLCDRSAIDPIVYALLTAIDEHDAKEKYERLADSEAFQRALVRYRSAIFVLLGPVQEWLVDDGVRNTENQLEYFGLFKKTLAELDISFYEIGEETMGLGDRVDRVLGIAQL